MHTPLLVAMATHQWLLISPSLSFFFPLHFCFYPFLCLVCNPYRLYLLFIYQLLCPCPEPCLCICVTEYPHLCVFILSTDMVSHDHVQGLVSHLWQGKDKDSQSAYAHERSHFVLIRSIIIMREEVTPWIYLGSYQGNLCDITPPTEQQGRCLVCPTLLIGSNTKSRG